ncbi:MAG: transcriptional regulator [Conexivisphaera sp.]|jgi:predicted DNA-binding transcriptional regulator
MSRDQCLGVLMLVLGVVVIIVYGWLDWAYPIRTLQVTAFIIVAAVLGIVAWIGYTLATTPPPKPIAEIEKELEEELKKVNEGEKGGGAPAQQKQ